MAFDLNLSPPENILEAPQDLVRYLFENFNVLDGFGELGAEIKYTQITTASYVISPAELVDGHNIFGVVHANFAVDIYLPNFPADRQIIIVKDESFNAATYPITLRVA